MDQVSQGYMHAERQRRVSVLTFLGFLLVRLQADFDLDGRNRHDLPIFALRYTFSFDKNGTYLVRTAYSFRFDFGQANMVEFSFLHHFF